ASGSCVSDTRGTRSPAATWACTRRSARPPGPCRVDGILFGREPLPAWMRVAVLYDFMDGVGGGECVALLLGDALGAAVVTPPPAARLRRGRVRRELRARGGPEPRLDLVRPEPDPRVLRPEEGDARP